jgi:hypothetical protein
MTNPPANTNDAATAISIGRPSPTTAAVRERSSSADE